MHVNNSEEPLYGNLQEKCRKPEWAQNADTHFVRACDVEMHFNMSQEALYTGIFRKNAALHWARNADTHFVRACAVETHVKISQESLYAEIYRKNMRATLGKITRVTPQNNFWDLFWGASST